MIELMLSALLTLVPDILYRTRVQGKRWGHEITLFNVWYELRWGLTACAILAINLITIIFFFHPTTNNISVVFRAVSIISERGGRVAEVFVRNNDKVKVGDPIFSLDTARQVAAADTARKQIMEIEAALGFVNTEIAIAEAQLKAAEATLKQATNDLSRRVQISERVDSAVSEQELETLHTAVSRAESQLQIASATLDGAKFRKLSILPSQLESAQAVLREAENEIAMSTVVAQVDGTMTQFLLKPGDIVNPFLRPAGVLVPDISGRGRFVAAFRQVSASVLKSGMFMEITCASRPLRVIPMVIDDIQQVIASGQFRPTDALLDQQDRARPGTITALISPIFPVQLEGVFLGSNCTGVAYSNHKQKLLNGEITGIAALAARIVDGMGIANAIVIRAQAILLPMRALIFD